MELQIDHCFIHLRTQYIFNDLCLYTDGIYRGSKYLYLMKFGVETPACRLCLAQPPGVDFCCVFIGDDGVYRGLSGEVG